MDSINKDKTPILSVEQFMDYFLDHEYDENMFTSNGHINPEKIIGKIFIVLIKI